MIGAAVLHHVVLAATAVPVVEGAEMDAVRTHERPREQGPEQSAGEDAVHRQPETSRTPCLCQTCAGTPVAPRRAAGATQFRLGQDAVRARTAAASMPASSPRASHTTATGMRTCRR